MARKGLVALVTILVGAIGCTSPTDRSVGPTTPSPEDAPDPGGRIVYVIDTPSCDDCYLTSIDPDGSDPLEYPDLSIGRWSPDGTRIAAVVVREDGRIGTSLVDADGSNVSSVDIPSPTLNLACFVWSPDGQTLLCEGWDEVNRQEAPGMFAVDVATNDVTRVTENRLGGNDIPADYSPDGTQILFAREDPSSDQGPMALFVAAADGSDQTRITWLSEATGGSWSPDGSLIVFNEDGQLQTIAPDGMEPTTIPVDFGEGFADPYRPAWSPDGSRIVFSLFLERTGQVDLFTVAADGTGLVQLTDSPEPDEFADWGPAPPDAG
jgi:Tol biopolymer transport system component